MRFYPTMKAIVMYNLAILLTSHNRKEKTLNCLKSITTQKNCSLFSATIYLVDDNSSDGTADAVKTAFPNANVIVGTGQLFWAGGMRKAWQAALNDKKPFTHFLLVNDDIFLYQDAFEKIFADKKMITEDAILIGSFNDPATSDFTYGGRALKNKYSLAANPVIPNNTSPQLCDLGNGNLMLVPDTVVKKIGILSNGYTHGIADFDYTLKAKKSGIPSYISSFYLGTCKNDFDLAKKKESRLSLKKRIDYLYSIKGLSYKEYLTFIRIYFPFYLPQAWLSLWVKTLLPI